MISHRNLILLCIGCVALVGGVAVTRFMPDNPYALGVDAFSIRIPINIPKLDPSFFEKKAPSLVAPPVPAGPVVSAQAYIVGNLKTGEIYAEHNSIVPLPIASMSKLMTALVATNSMTPTTTIEVTPLEATVFPDLSNLKPGERFTMKELLYPLLLNSSNVAAEALASSTNRGKFIDLMNGYAWEIGLPTSYFADPSGLSALNAASARGFFAMAKYIYTSRSDLLAITRVSTSSVATTTDHGSHNFVSIHPFVNDPRFLGGKTGHTPEAGDTMLTILSIGGQPIAFIVLGSNDRKADTSLLIDQVGSSLAKN